MWSDNETSEDLFGFKVHADLLIDVINDESVLPVTIGVFGDWGSGKSSILKIIKNEIDKEDNKESLCIYFNGWTFEGYDDAKAALLNSILKQLEKNKKLTEEVTETVKEKAKKLWKSIDWMRGAGLALKNVALPAISAYFTGGVSLIPFFTQKISEFGLDKPENFLSKINSDEGKALLKSLIKENEEQNEKTNQVAEFRKDFTELLEATKFKSLVVIIDDLDRCTPERIIENLEAIKLFLNVPKTAFVIGADPRIVKHAIEQKYTSSEVAEDKNSRIVVDYLEKLIQLPYSLPKLSEPEVETYISLLIAKKELNSENFTKLINAFYTFRERDRLTAFGLLNFKEVLESADFEKIKSNVISIPTLVPLITHSLYGNPRQIKRFLNTYTLRQRLSKVAKLSEFNDAILAKLMILEYSEPQLFKKIFEWQSLQDGIPNQITKIESICAIQDSQKVMNDLKESGFEEWNKEKVVKWLQIEPNLSNVDLLDYFWISRDNISSFTTNNLISPLVKALFNAIIAENLPATVSKEILNNKLSELTTIEKLQFFEFLTANLTKYPEKKRLFDIFSYLFELKINESIRYFKDGLIKISDSEINIGVGIMLKSYKNHPDLGSFLDEYFKNKKSKAANAYNKELSALK